jgi:hypothetical protein
MRRFVALACLICSGCGSAASWQWAPPQSLPKPPAAGTDHPAIVLSRHDTYDLVTDINDNHLSFQRHQVIAILGEAGFNQAQVTIKLKDDDRLVLLKARTISPSGEVHEVEPEMVIEDQAKVEVARDEHERITVRKFRFPGVKVGSLLEYVWRRERPGWFAFFSEEIADEIPVAHYRLEFRMAPEVRYAFKLYNATQPFRTEEANGVRRVTLDLDNIPAVEDEPYALAWQLHAPWWAFRARSFRLTRRHSYSGIDSWDSVYERDAEKLDAGAAKLTKGVDLRAPTSGCQDPRCTIEKAWAFVRDRTDLDGWGLGKEPRPMSEVLADGRARAFEKALLLAYVLRSANVVAYLAWTARDPGLAFDHEFPSRGRGDHVLVFVPAQPGVDRALFLDPSCEACAVGQIPVWDADREALVVATRASTVLGTHVTTGFVPITGEVKAENSRTLVHLAELKADGSARDVLTVTRGGSSAVDRRLHTRSWPPAKWRKEAESTFGGRMPNARIERHEPVSYDKVKGVGRESITVELPSLGVIEGERMLVPLSLLGVRWDDTFVKKRRTRDISVRFALADVEEIVMRLPPGYAVAELPPAERASAPALEVAFEAKAEPGQVRVRRELRLRQGHYGLAAYPEIQRVMQTFIGWRKQALVLKRAPQR